mgnify:CR=1 FL=1
MSQEHHQPKKANAVVKDVMSMAVLALRKA